MWYIGDFEQAYVLHDQLGLNLAQEENRSPVLDTQNQHHKKLINCLYAEPSTQSTIWICLAANYSFDHMIEFLGNKAFMVNHYDQVEATQRSQPRRANVAFNSDSMQQFFEAMLVVNLPKEQVLPEQLYQCIPNEARMEFNKARNQLVRESEKHDGDTKPQAVGQLLKRYTARANVAMQEATTAPMIEEVNEEDEASAAVPTADFISMLSRYHGYQQ